MFSDHCEDPEVMNVFALCPVCHDSVEPGQGTIEGTMLHFELHKCAAALLQGDFALCHTGCRVRCANSIVSFVFCKLVEVYITGKGYIQKIGCSYATARSL